MLRIAQCLALVVLPAQMKETCDELGVEIVPNVFSAGCDGSVLILRETPGEPRVLLRAGLPDAGRRLLRRRYPGEPARVAGGTEQDAGGRGDHVHDVAEQVRSPGSVWRSRDG